MTASVLVFVFVLGASIFQTATATAQAGPAHDTPKNLTTTMATNDAPPTMSPWNLGFRFVLELGALGAMAWWGYEQRDDLWRWPLAMGVPLLAAAAWAAFTMPGDPSRGGEGLVHVPGVARLALELAMFGFGTWALADLDHTALALGYGTSVTVHYVISYARIAWLLGI